MKNKNVFYIIVGILAVILLIFLISKKDGLISSLEKIGEENENSVNNSRDASGTATTNSKPTRTVKTPVTSGATKVSTTGAATESNFPDIDFIEKRILFPLKDFPGIKITIEKVVFGRGDSVKSTGCSGIPNVNFSTYLYPGSVICLSAKEVNGSPMGIVAFHLLVENNSSVGFGGNSDALKLHYLRSDSIGNPSFRFAHPIMGLANYYINGYSSDKIILSYLVPEDQLIFNLVAGYKEPALENKTLNVYEFSSNGLFIDFGLKSLKIVK